MMRNAKESLRRPLPILAVALALVATGCQSSHRRIEAPSTAAKQLDRDEQDALVRYFLLVGRPNAKAWNVMKANPGDREAATAGALKKVGYVKGVGKVPMDQPKGNLTGDPWFSDGYRLVLWVTPEPTDLSEMQVLPWRNPYVGD